MNSNLGIAACNRFDPNIFRAAAENCTLFPKFGPAWAGKTGLW